MNEIIENIQVSVTNAWDKVIASLPSFAFGLVLIVIAFFLARVISNFADKRLANKTNDVLVINFAKRMIRFVIILLGVLGFMQIMGWTALLGGLVAGAGVTAIALGFAFKDIGENFIAGFFLAFGRPFDVGDWVRLEDEEGTVRQLNYRTTHMRTFDGRDVYVPNAAIVKNKVINFTRDGLLRHDYIIGIDYGASADEAMGIIRKELASISEINHAANLKPTVIVDDLTSSTLNLKVLYWTDSNHHQGSNAELKGRIVTKTLRSLNDAGIALPGDILEVKPYDGNGFKVDNKPQTEQKTEA